MKTLARLCGIALVSLIGMFGGASDQANAATYNFEFSNVDGTVNGTVAGYIVLPDGDGVFAATEVMVTSAPAALGYTLALDVLALATNLVNSFTVVGGQIDQANSAFIGVNSSEGLVLQHPAVGSFLNIVGSADVSVGVQDVTNSTLTFTAVAPVPLPASAVLLLAGLSGLALARRRSTAS